MMNYNVGHDDGLNQTFISFLTLNRSISILQLLFAKATFTRATFEAENARKCDEDFCRTCLDAFVKLTPVCV